MKKTVLFFTIEKRFQHGRHLRQNIGMRVEWHFVTTGQHESVNPLILGRFRLDASQKSVTNIRRVVGRRTTKIQKRYKQF